MGSTFDIPRNYMAEMSYQFPKEERTDLSLIQKLARIQSEIKRVAKRGVNEFHRYNYATEADISDTVRTLLAENGIMIIPSVKTVDVELIPKAKDGNRNDRLVRLLVNFCVTTGNESINFNIVGEGVDSGDKASYKAMTGATKYALMKLFLIPTGDDPENEKANKEEEESVVEKLRDLFRKARDAGLATDAITFTAWAHPLLGHTKPVGAWDMSDYLKLEKEITLYTPGKSHG